MQSFALQNAWSCTFQLVVCNKGAAPWPSHNRYVFAYSIDPSNTFLTPSGVPCGFFLNFHSQSTVVCHFMHTDILIFLFHLVLLYRYSYFDSVVHFGYVQSFFSTSVSW